MHSNSSLVQVKCGDDIKPAFVLKYIKIATIIALPGCIDDKCMNIYMAAISWLKDHPNKTWFNHHNREIWRNFQSVVIQIPMLLYQGLYADVHI